MTNTSLRRAGVSLVGLVSAVFLAVGCSSDSNGTPPAGSQGGGGNQGGNNQGGGNSGGGNQGPGAATSAAGGGGSGDFCTDFKSIGELTPSDFTSPDKAKKVVEVWDRLADEAPAAIKSDVQAIDDFLKSVQSGKADLSKVQKLGQMNLRIARYIQTNC